MFVGGRATSFYKLSSSLCSSLSGFALVFLLLTSSFLLPFGFIDFMFSLCAWANVCLVQFGQISFAWKGTSGRIVRDKYHACSGDRPNGVITLGSWFTLGVDFTIVAKFIFSATYADVQATLPR